VQRFRSTFAFLRRTASERSLQCAWRRYNGRPATIWVRPSRRSQGREKACEFVGPKRPGSRAASGSTTLAAFRLETKSHSSCPAECYWVRALRGFRPELQSGTPSIPRRVFARKIRSDGRPVTSAAETAS
jgi:hypothetical protein